MTHSIEGPAAAASARRWWIRLAVSAALALAPDPSHAQHAHATVAPVAPGAETRAPLLAASPVLDGVIAPGEWEGASVLSGFTQKEPRDGEGMTEPTEVRLARHGNRLYIAFIAWDREMPRVRAELTPRDRFEESADVVAVVIDPVRSGSRGYTFVFNPLGVQYDGVWTDEVDFGWDGVVESSGRVEADRYVVEVAIPFSTVLTGGAAGEDWAVNFGRRIPRRSEEGWWVAVPRTDARMLAHMGTMTEMGDARHRSRLALIPTATAQGTRAAGRSAGTTTTWGATVRIPVGEALRVEGTFRPDFSFVETDAPQLGFNERFALFYPEKRPFFLEQSDRFMVRETGAVSSPLRLVHTRTIVRPRLGARVIASPAGGFLGAMFLAERDEDGDDDGSAAIVRAARNGPFGSIAGVTATQREREGRRNTVVAADAQAYLAPDVVLTLQRARSTTDEANAGGTRSGNAMYLDLSRENDAGVQQLVYTRVDRDFETDVGFVERRDVQTLLWHGGLYWRPASGPLLHVFPMTQNFVAFDQEGRRIEVEHTPHVQFQLTRQTSLEFKYRFGEERFRGRDHSQARSELLLSSTPLSWLDLSLTGKVGRRIRYDFEHEDRDFTFVAAYREVRAEASVRADVATTISLAGSWRKLGGDAALDARSAWVTRARATRFITTTCYARAVVQYDSELRRREGSLLLGRELNYGTQFHVGMDYASTPRPLAEGRVARASFFARASWLFDR